MDKRWAISLMPVARSYAAAAHAQRPPFGCLAAWSGRPGGAGGGQARDRGEAHRAHPPRVTQGAASVPAESARRAFAGRRRRRPAAGPALAPGRKLQARPSAPEGLASIACHRGRGGTEEQQPVRGVARATVQGTMAQPRLPAGAHASVPALLAPPHSPPVCVPRTSRYEEVFLEAANLVSSGALGDLTKLDLVCNMPLDSNNRCVEPFHTCHPQRCLWQADEGRAPPPARRARASRVTAGRQLATPLTSEQDFRRGMQRCCGCRALAAS